MFSKREIKQMKKGFYPSRTGKSPNAIVGKGDSRGNRAFRRRGLIEDRSLRSKSKMIIIGKDRFLAFSQRIITISKKGFGEVRWVEHMINISKPNC